MDLVESRQRVVRAEERHPWELARLDAIARVIRDTVPLEPGDWVLDVGCGDAFFVAQLARRYPQATFVAVDPALTPEMITALQAAWTVPNVTFARDLDAVAGVLHGRGVRLVLLLDVIEHVADDIAFLRQLRTRPFVAADTTFVITVPAFQALFCSHDTYLGHYRRYTHRMLDAHSTQGGLQPLKTIYFFGSLLLPRALQVMKEQWLGMRSTSTTGLAQWNGHPALARFLRWGLLMDFGISWWTSRIGLRLWGLSTLTICRPARR